MGFTLLNSVMKLIDKGFEFFNKAEQKTYGKVLEQNQNYESICDDIDMGNKRGRDAWNEPVDYKYCRDSDKPKPRD